MAVTELNIRYMLFGANNSVVTFNDPTDPNYVGMLTEVTGLDSPEIRESASDLVQMDGGIHGDFFYGRRPITLSGIILNPASPTERNARQEALSQASDVLRQDGLLLFQPSGASGFRYLAVRRQQPLRVTGAWQKTFQLGLVAADPRIYSFLTNDATLSPNTVVPGRTYSRVYPRVYPATSGAIGTQVLTNRGTTPTYPSVTIVGPATNPTIINRTTNESLRLIYTLNAGDSLVIDFLNRTVMLNASASRYSAVDFTNSTWWALQPGDNAVGVNYDSVGAGAFTRVDWRDAWM